MQTKREEEQEQPMTTMARTVRTAAPAGPRELTTAQPPAGDARRRALFASSLLKEH